MNIIWEETISFHPKALAVSEKGILLAFYGNPGGFPPWPSPANLWPAECSPMTCRQT